jgi:hypothetical protein
MKMALGWRVVVVAGLVGTLARVGFAADQIPFKGKGGENLGVVVLCNDCKSATGKDCQTGAEEGWLDGKACGKCLLESNWGTMPESPYDIHIVGILVDPEKKPIKDRFVKMFLPNGWGVRTRTDEEGKFRLTLGATKERKGEPAVLDIGTRVDTVKGTDPQYAIFWLPDPYKPCTRDPQPAKPDTPKPEQKKGRPS